MDKQVMLENIRRTPNTGPRGTQKIKNILKNIVTNSEGGDDTSVLRTTPQELTYEQQETALSNLGLYPLAGVPEKNIFECAWGFDCETRLLDVDTLAAIKSVPDGDSCEDPTFRYILKSSDDSFYCIVFYKHTENGEIYIEVLPHKAYIPQDFSLDGTSVGYKIDENTGEITDCHVFLADGNDAINKALLVKNSVIDLYVKRDDATVIGIQVHYGGIICTCFCPVMFFTLIESSLSFVGKVYKMGYSFDYEEFQYYSGSSGSFWGSASGKSVAFDSGTHTLKVHIGG